MASVLLRFWKADSDQKHIELVRYANISTYYLPDEVDDVLRVRQTEDEAHSLARLDVADHYTCLSVYGTPRKPSTLLCGDQAIDIPVSTTQHQFSFVLRNKDEFVTAAGRWRLESIPSKIIPVPPGQTEQPCMTEPFYSTASEEQRNSNSQPEKDMNDQNELLHKDDQHQTVSLRDKHESPAAQRFTNTDCDHALSMTHPISTSPSVHDTNVPKSKGGSKDDGYLMDVSDNDDEYGEKNGAAVQKMMILIANLEHDTYDIVEIQNRQLLQARTRMCEIEDENTPRKVSKASAAEVTKSNMTSSQITSKTQSPLRNRDITSEPSSIFNNDTDHLHQLTAQSYPGNPLSTQSAASRIQLSRQAEVSYGETMLDFNMHTPGEMICHSDTASQPQALHPRPGQSRPVIVFSSTTSKVQNDKKVMKSYKKLGGLVVNDLSNANIFCAGNDSLKKTAKFVLAVATGRYIVTDKWLKDVHTKQKLLDPESYLPQDAEKEAEWNFNLRDAVARGKQGLTLLNGFEVFLTTQVQRELGDLKLDIKKLAMTMGANRVGMRLPKKVTAPNHTLVIGSPNNDPQNAKARESQLNVYSKDLLTMAALRGRLELQSDEFLLQD